MIDHRYLLVEAVLITELLSFIKVGFKVVQAKTICRYNLLDLLLL